MSFIFLHISYMCVCVKFVLFDLRKKDSETELK